MGAGGSRFVVTARVGPWIPASVSRWVERTGMTVQVAPEVACPALRAGLWCFAPLALGARFYGCRKARRAEIAQPGATSRAVSEAKEERNVQ